MKLLTYDELSALATEAGDLVRARMPGNVRYALVLIQDMGDAPVEGLGIPLLIACASNADQGKAAFALQGVVDGLRTVSRKADRGALQ